MRFVAPGLFAFALLIAAHIVVWRIRRPAGQYVALAILAVGVLAVTLAAPRIAAGALGAALDWLPRSPLEHVTAIGLYASLVLSYVTTYSAVQADSPTMTILLDIERSGAAGCTRDELRARLDDRVLVVPRLDDLVAGRLVRLEHGRYVVTSGGIAMSAPHVAFRRWLKMEKGG
jgi:hypothetical protein